MALKLIKSSAQTAVHGYAPYWYGAYRDGGRVKSVALGVRVRGIPPESGYIGDLGDERFEQSRQEAQAKLDKLIEQSQNKSDVRREQETLIKMKLGHKTIDPKLDELALIYLKRIGERSACQVSMIKSGFTKFAQFAHSPQHRNIKSANILGEVTPELAMAFFQDIVKRYSYSTVKKWSHRLTNAYSMFFPYLDNPFVNARANAMRELKLTDEMGEKVRLETVIHHRPIDREQLRKIYSVAKINDLIYGLAVTAASTGLRISDVRLLKWKSIDFDRVHPVIHLKTVKTGADVAIPIFDYRKDSEDYEPDLGEFRRVLEKQKAIRKENERYVFPEAAHLYLKIEKYDANGNELPQSQWKTPGRGIIYTWGKQLFAKVLNIVDDDDMTAMRNLSDYEQVIYNSDWDEERKQRAINVFKARVNGDIYDQIQFDTGYAKSTISVTIADVNNLLGIKKVNRPTKREQLAKTRQQRVNGCRSASVYSWHSLRGTFVVMMLDNGVPIDKVRALVGHQTVEMTMQYYNPTEVQAADNAREIIVSRNRANSNKISASDILSALSQMDKDKRNELIKQLQNM